MKKCKNCGAEIPDSANYCDICGAYYGDAKKMALKAYLLKLVIVLVPIIILAVILTPKNTPPATDEDPYNLASWECIITQEQYNKLIVDENNGTTYNEAVKIVGGEAKFLYNSDDWDVYRWPGNLGKNDYVEIHVDKKTKCISMKSEYNFLRSNELNDFFATGNKLNAPLITEQQLNSIKENMNMPQVEEIFNGPGVLAETTSTDWGDEDFNFSTEGYAWRYDNAKGYVIIRFSDDHVYEVVK